VSYPDEPDNSRRDTWDELVPDSLKDSILDRSDSLGNYEDVYQQNELVFYETALFNDIPDDRMPEFWNDYIDAMVLGDMSHAEFFEYWDIDPAEFDWAEWREAMGYD
jgi:hypothetical protein